MRRNVVLLDGQEPPARMRGRKSNAGGIGFESNGADEGNTMQPIEDGDSSVSIWPKLEELESDWPSPEEFERVAEAVEKILHNEETRTAWIMGFLTGSALVGDPDGATKLERIRGRPLPRGA